MNKTHDITNEVVTDYINQFYMPLNEDLGALRLDAEANNVPIIVKETETFLRTFFSIYKPKRVLEIGTAVGYSASLFAELINVCGANSFSTRTTFSLESEGKTEWEPKTLKSDAKTVCGASTFLGRATFDLEPEAKTVREPQTVCTLERDDEMYEQAVSNIKKLGLENSIEIMHGDAIESLQKLKERNEKFDFLFIDAAKSHYKEFLDEALPLLEAGSVIIADNTIFRGRVASDDFDPSGKYKTNIKKLREFNKYIMEDPRFESTVQAIGDGLTIIKLL